MGCPWLGDVVDSAINRCPFLNSVKAANGEAFARTLAMNPGNKVREPIFPESLSDFKASFHLFHGANGVVPLARCDDLPAPETSNKDASQARGCPFQGQQAARQPAAEAESGHGVAALHSGGSRGHPLEAAPFASLTTRVFRFLPGPEEFIARRRKRRQERRDRRADRQRQGRGKPGTQAKQSGLEKWRAHPVVGGLLPLNAAGKYVCPPLVVAGRAAVAQLRTTKFLRPQALPLKLLGVGAHCLVANVPCGAVREHTRKFSPAWFLAVHATVPFFAFMRKGVGMPRWAIVLTLAAAVAGQAIGARLERARLQWALEGREEACPVLKSCSQVGKGVMAEAPLAPLVVA